MALVGAAGTRALLEELAGPTEIVTCGVGEFVVWFCVFASDIKDLLPCW
jgi:hypothetical protein